MKPLSSILLGFGFVLLLISATMILKQTLQHNSFSTNYKSYQEIMAVSVARTPERVIIDDIAVDLPILAAEIDEKNSWQVSDKGINYLITSPVPGEDGNSIMYGHNWPNLLGRLPSLKTGADIEVVYSDNTRKTFTVTTTKRVTPDDLSVLAQGKDALLTLYTCVGFMDSHRFVVVAKPKLKQYANSVTF